MRAVKSRLQAIAAARPSQTLGLGMAILSAVIYAWTVFSLPQVRDNAFVCERSSVAAAVSNVLYRTRPGVLSREILNQLLQHLDAPLEEMLDEIPRDASPPGGGGRRAWLRTTEDGNGAGFPLVATVAFRLAGIHAWALTLVTVGLMTASGVMFLARFTAARAGVVVLYFAALTMMLFTSLVWSPLAVQIPVGGIRYFSLIAVLPIFHLLLEFADPERPAWNARRWRYWLLGVQAAILALAIIVRGSALPVLGEVALVWLVLAWRWRRDPAKLPSLLRKAGVSLAVGLGLLGLMFVVVPSDYHTKGRFGTVIWHRITLSFGANPAWPFPGVNDLFDCKTYFPEGIQPGMPDTNGQCIWVDYAAKHHVSPWSYYDNKTYSGPYETALRAAFFEIVARYPAETAAAFLYWKPLQILPSLRAAGELDFRNYSSTAILLFVVASVLLLSVPIFLVGISSRQVSGLIGVAALSAIFTLPSYLAVWPLPHTVADLLLNCLLLASLGLCGVSLAVRAALSGWRSARPA
jgi:hypothetical protein